MNEPTNESMNESDKIFQLQKIIEMDTALSISPSLFGNI